MLVEALKEWNKKDEKSSGQTEAETIAIMFTEIMGYTELTQKAGDAEAQDILRPHNGIVRAAITRFSGKEVKHLGYGIMASFDGVTNSVEAANAIQRGVENFNLARKHDPMGVRIGIHAGEPIREEDDIFGSAVQMAAPICAIAATGEVMVSGVVASICRGKAMKFENRGTREIKGFPDPVAVFSSKWKVEPAAAE
ncbi:MAG: adenylate/guanylate cyclase domain-containing protein [Rhodospirillaceae bacterium]